MSPDKESKLLGIIKERYESAARYQRAKYDEWERSRLFYRGDQYLTQIDRRLKPASREKWRVRLAINKLIPIVELSISTFLQNKPIVVGIPASDDADDRRSSRLVEALSKYYWDFLELDDKLHELLTWVFVCGDAFVRVSWDESAGKKVPVQDIVQQPIIDDETGEESIEESVGGVLELKHQGEPCVDIIDPFSLTVEPGATTLEDAHWVMITEVLRKSVIEQRFDEKVPDSDAGDEMSYIPIQLDRSGRKPSKDRVALHTMYERPTKKNPNGRVVYATETKVLQEDELDGGDCIPIVHFQNIRLPGEFFGTSIVAQAIPLQAELNRTRSQLVENRNLTLRPKMIAAEGQLSQGSITTKPGEIVEYDPTASPGSPEPHYMDLKGVPQIVMQELGLIIEDLNDLTSRHEASQGKMTGSATSGKMFQSQRSSDNARYTPAVRLFERGLGKMTKYIMKMLQLYADSERIVSIVGRNRQPEVVQFTGADLSDRTNVKFDIASQLAWSRDTQRQQLYWMYSQNLIEKEELMERIQWPSTQYEYEVDQDHRMNARMENDWLFNGELIEPLHTDDHDVHLQEHERMLNAPENREVFVKTDNGKQILQIFMQHMEIHKKGLPGPEPEPPQKRIQLHGEIDPRLATQIAGQSAQQGAPGEEGEQPPEQPGMATPPGGMSGDMYGEVQ